jgi:hypothetical protein
MLGPLKPQRSRSSNGGNSEAWNDEDAPSTAAASSTKAVSPAKENTAANHRRRRLSVSTVDAKPPKAAMESGEFGNDYVVDAEVRKGAKQQGLSQFGELHICREIKQSALKSTNSAIRLWSW